MYCIYWKNKVGQAVAALCEKQGIAYEMLDDADGVTDSAVLAAAGVALSSTPAAGLRLHCGFPGSWRGASYPGYKRTDADEPVARLSAAQAGKITGC